MNRLSETVEIRVECPHETMGLLSDWLLGTEGVLAVQELYTGLPGEETVQTLLVYADEPEFARTLSGMLSEQPLFSRCGVTNQKIIQEEDWAESWKQHWHVTPITERLTIRPSWEEYTPKNPEEIMITLDPGSAFGTGAHETTRLMLEAMEKLADNMPFSQLSLLDVGTGSGILAIYAAKRGCHQVMALDIDPVAVQAAQENIDLNRVSDRVTVTATPLISLCQTTYDIVVANILAPVIVSLLPEICLRLRSNGILLASGLIETSVGNVESAMREAGFVNIERFRQGDWFGLRGIYRRAD